MMTMLLSYDATIVVSLLLGLTYFVLDVVKQ